MLASLLGALYRVPKSPDLPVGWHWRPPRGDLTWRSWLSERLVDDPNPDVHDWRAALTAQSEADRIFRPVRHASATSSKPAPSGVTWSTGTSSMPTS